MPIVQDPDYFFSGQDEPHDPSTSHLTKPRTSDESIRIGSCDGPIPSGPSLDKRRQGDVGYRQGGSENVHGTVCTSDRNELMERIKRGESPTWIPSQTLQKEYSKNSVEWPPVAQSKPIDFAPSPILPPADAEDNENVHDERYATEFYPPSEIKRPRSALHAGDFTKGSDDTRPANQHISTSTEAAGLTAQDLTEPSSSVDHEPSPYVGLIDLQQLPAPAESKKTHRSRSKSPSKEVRGSGVMQIRPKEDSMQSIEENTRSKRKRRRTPPVSVSPGSYRIPQRGQLQIVIKNPNKTAVKLFLIPYDLEGMETGTKTFIRQRCYSTDPIIDGILPEPKSVSPTPFKVSPSSHKPTLRYLVHVNICSPSNGRFYLYQHIRVVFANRVPDNKEQLQTEIQIPQPRYSPYNPNTSLSRSISTAGSKFARDMVQRKQASDLGVGYEGMDDRHPQALGSGTSYPSLLNSPSSAVPAIPLNLLSGPPVEPNSKTCKGAVDGSDRTRNAGNGDKSPFSINDKAPTSPTSPTPALAFPRLPIARTRRLGKSDLGIPRPAEEQDMDIDSSSSTFQSPSGDRTSQHCCCHKRLSNPSPSHGEVSSAYIELSRADPEWGGRTMTPEYGEGLLGRRLRDFSLQRTMEHREEYER
ncbi:MAG: hypothetical protein Q9222_004140 [Ikaeria aurantiellina]